jgi:hypothetical protein
VSSLVCGASVESNEGDFMIEASMDNWPPSRGLRVAPIFLLSKR